MAPTCAPSRDGEVVGAMKRQGKEGEFRSNLHRGGSGIAEAVPRRKAAVSAGHQSPAWVLRRRHAATGWYEVNSLAPVWNEKATCDIAGRIIEYTTQSIDTRASRKPRKQRAGGRAVGYSAEKYELVGTVACQ
jgi:ribosomal protein S6--L-glutamate ligase